MIMPQPSHTQDIQVVRSNQATGTTTFISNSGVVSNILTAINVDGTTYHQLEPGMFQVIAPVAVDGTMPGLSVNVNQ